MINNGFWSTLRPGKTRGGLQIRSARGSEQKNWNAPAGNRTPSYSSSPVTVMTEV